MVKKSIVTLALVIVLSGIGYVIPVSATEISSTDRVQSSLEKAITPRWESTKRVLPSIAIAGKQISASVYISPLKSTTTTTGILYLEKKSGNGWITVTSWAFDATGTVSITKTYNGTAGITYRVRVVATTGADKIDATSGECTL